MTKSLCSHRLRQHSSYPDRQTVTSTDYASPDFDSAAEMALPLLDLTGGATFGTNARAAGEIALVPEVADGTGPYSYDRRIHIKRM